jgi:NitT/TauT family transport system permease protein
MGNDPLMKSQTNDTKSAPTRWRARLVNAVQFVLPFLVIGIVWELVVRTGLVSQASLPSPSGILSKFWELSIGEGLLWRHLGRSMVRLSVGYAMAMISGLLFGTVLAMNRILREMFSPILSLLISVPTIAWIPVFLITLGMGDRTVIAAVFLGGFFAITYNTVRGIEMVDVNRIRAARTMGARGPRLFTAVLLPGSSVSVLTGLRLGIGYSWRALVGGEMLSAMVQWGIGKMIYQARFWNDVSVMFVGLLIIGLTGFLLDRLLIRWLERVTIERWGMVTER